MSAQLLCAAVAVADAALDPALFRLEIRLYPDKKRAADLKEEVDRVELGWLPLEQRVARPSLVPGPRERTGTSNKQPDNNNDS